MLTSRDRLAIREGLDVSRLDSRFLHVLIPAFDNWDFDEETQSGNEVSQGDGTGRSVTWRHYALYAHLRPVDQSLITFGHVPPGAEQGNVFFSIHPRELEVFQNALNREHAYVLLDGEAWHVNSITTSGVGKVEEYIVNVKKFHPLHRAPGY
jgi:hypothetical protein